MKGIKIISLTTSIYLVVVSTLFYISCNREKGNVNGLPTKSDPIKIRTDKSKYDNYGAMHNLLVSTYNDNYNHTSLAETFKRMKIIASELGYTYKDVSENTFVEITKDKNGDFFDDEIALLNSLKSKYQLFNNDQITFNNKIERFKDFINQMESLVTPDEAWDFFDAYEATIDNTTMSEEERYSIMCCIYTARHSLQYWKNYLNPVDLNKNARGNGLRCWACVVGYDALWGVLTTGLSGNPLVGVLGGATWSVFARYCLCKKCNQYKTVSCG